LTDTGDRIGFRHSLVIVGGPDERDQVRPLLGWANHEPRVTDLVGRTSVARLMAVIARSSLVVANDSAVASMLNEGLYLDRTMSYQSDLYKKIDDLTPTQVSTALRNYVNLGTMVKVKAGDLPTEKVD